MQVHAVRGDVTAERVDAVVNAANGMLVPGTGVAGAIHRRGGPSVYAECRRLLRDRYPAGLPAGQVLATSAGDLPCRWVIHAVGPVWSPTEDRSRELASCYTEALRAADALGARSVAFPAISTGVYRWPLADAARIAVRAVRGARTTAVTEVRFVLFDDTALAAFSAALAADPDSADLDSGDAAVAPAAPVPARVAAPPAGRPLSAP